MAIPPDLIATLTEYAKGTKFFGKPIEELTREELIAAIGACQQQFEADKRRHESDARMRDALDKARHTDRFGREVV